MGFPVQGGLAGAPRSRAMCPFCWCHRHSLDRPPWRHSRMVGSIHSLPLCHQTHGPCIWVAKERGCLTCTGEITLPPGYWAAVLQWVLPTGHWYRTKRCPHSILLSESAHITLLLCLLLVVFLQGSDESGKSHPVRSLSVAYLLAPPCIEDGGFALS